MCLSVCPAPRVLPLRATERPTEGTYGFSAIWETSSIWRFLFVQKLWREKANKLISMCLPQHDMAPMERHLARYFGLFWFFQSLTAGYKLPGIVRERATSDSSVQLVQFFFVSVYFPCSLTRALSTHAQQLFSASTPGQILAPRVCTLVHYNHHVPIVLYGLRLFIVVLQELQCFTNILLSSEL